MAGFFYQNTISNLPQVFGYMIPAGSIHPSLVSSSHQSRIINISARAGKVEQLIR